MRQLTYSGKIGWDSIGSGAKSRTAIMDGVEMDFCSGNLVGMRRNCSASLLAFILLKSFWKWSKSIFNDYWVDFLVRQLSF